MILRRVVAGCLVAHLGLTWCSYHAGGAYFIYSQSRAMSCSIVVVATLCAFAGLKRGTGHSERSSLDALSVVIGFLIVVAAFLTVHNLGYAGPDLLKSTLLYSSWWFVPVTIALGLALTFNAVNEKGSRGSLQGLFVIVILGTALAAERFVARDIRLGVLVGVVVGVAPLACVLTMLDGGGKWIARAGSAALSIVVLLGPLI